MKKKLLSTILLAGLMSINLASFASICLKCCFRSVGADDNPSKAYKSYERFLEKEFRKQKNIQ